MFVHRTNQGSGQTIEALAEHGHNAYILSASTRFDRALAEAFHTDSYIRITDSTNFGITVSRQIPSLINGIEGYCLYQDNKIIEKDLGYIDLKQFRDLENQGQLNVTKLNHFINSRMGHYPMFLKDKHFVHQSEYRFVWLIRKPASDYIDIEVPEAIQFCQKPNTLVE